MTHKFPKLTVENVINWYWSCDPGWSTIDISREIGCSTTTVFNFMNNNGIPTRDHSKASINRFLCQFKKENFLKIRQSKEVRNKTSETLVLLWSNPKKRKDLIKGLKNRISEREKIILQTLYTKGPLFISDFNIITSDKYIKHTLYLLFQRKYVDRKKEFNLLNNGQKKYLYRYWITDKGIKILSLHLGDKFKALEKSNSMVDYNLNENDIKKIIELRKKGYSFIEIGKRVNQSKYIVQQILIQFLDNYNDFLMRKSKYNHKIIKKIISLRKSLLKIREISKIVDVPESTVKKNIK